MKPKFPIRLMQLTFGIVAVVSILLSACNSKAKHSPEVQRFLDACQSVTDDMTEEEVDKLLDGYLVSAADRITNQTAGGKTLKRESIRNKYFCSAKIITEGEFVAQIYFDASGRVVGKWWTQLNN